ncbi:GATA zinc finger domain-containing protein 10-like [Belonocnema kinseyi]|uniref:GATA zinc finger domain-containing protein 10-like n=1 Tax=Belonocnema kinseyi TaxID=2817044 RepID=UPI00143CC7E9|nr:GATA zinc finger domain-containing protein 10-like [Belonocnema kinseyi]
MEVNHKIEIENHGGDGVSWSDSIATEFIDGNWCDSPLKKEPTYLMKESVTPMPAFEEQQQLQNSIPYQQLMHTLKGPSTVDQQNQIIHLLKNNPSLMSTFKKQKQQQSRMNGVINPMGPSQVQQLPNLQHMYPQQPQHHQPQQPQSAEDPRVQEHQFQGHSRVTPGVQFPQQYGVPGGRAGQVGAENTSSVHNRAYDQLIDSLKRATTVAQQKKILQTLRSNPSLMAVYLNKCKQNEEHDERVDTLDHNQQQSMQHVLSQQHQYQQCQPGMGINDRMPPVGLICKENISTLHDEAYQQLAPTLKSPHSPNQKQQVLRNIKSNPATMAALRKHRQKQAGQNSGGAGTLVPSQSQNQDSALHLIVPQQPVQQEQYRNQVYQQPPQLPQHLPCPINQELPLKIEPINPIDSENAILKQSAAYEKLIEILKRPNTPERQNHILHLVKCNPLLRSAFAKKRQLIEQQSGISVAQNKPLHQPGVQHVLPPQEQYKINQQLQQQSAQGPSLQQNPLHWYTQQQHPQEQQYGNMAALKHTTSPEKINQIIRDLQGKPGLISDFAEQRQHEEVHPLHSIPPQQSQLQQILFQPQNQQSQPPYSLGPTVPQYQHESLTQTSPPSYEPQNPNSSSSMNYVGFEQDYGQASWNPTSPMQQLKQLVETPSPAFSSPSIPSPQSVLSPINRPVSFSEVAPEPSSHFQPLHPPHDDQNYSPDHELYVPSGILSLESYPVNCNDTSEMLKITPQDLFDFVNKL